eukprot:scaffold45520_cov64-Phaeocystis_antarctica.AAC.15
MAAHQGSPVCSCAATRPSTASAIGPVAAAVATSLLSWRARGRSPLGRASCGGVRARSARRHAVASIAVPTRRAPWLLWLSPLTMPQHASAMG